jgi:FkbM family methyltransferase
MTLARLRLAIARNRAARAALYPAVLLKRALEPSRREIVEDVLRNLERCLADDPLVNLREYDGTFSVDRRSHLFARIAAEGAYEPALAAACAAHLDPSRDAIDVGANVGFYTTLLARKLAARRVLAIEPTRNALVKLHGNLARNAVEDRVIVFEGVASDREGTLEINTVAGKEEYSSLGALSHPSVDGEERRTERVASATIDGLVLRHGLVPGFIKIDVEGAEHRVLSGATETLRAHRPVVLSELSASLLRRNGSSAAEVVAYMRRLGYRIVDPLRPSGAFAEKEFGDMLCLPV